MRSCLHIDPPVPCSVFHAFRRLELEPSQVWVNYGSGLPQGSGRRSVIPAQVSVVFRGAMKVVMGNLLAGKRAAKVRNEQRQPAPRASAGGGLRNPVDPVELGDWSGTMPDAVGL